MTERTTLFVEVILPVPIHKEFTYRVPVELNPSVAIGSRVIVPFGKGKLYTGIITSIHGQAPTAYTAKYIEHVLDDQPIVTSNQLTFWRWIANYYMAGIGEVMNAALPSNFKLASETKIVLHPEIDEHNAQLDEREQQILDALEINESMDLKEIAEIIGIQTVQPIIKKMMEKRLVITLESLNERYTPKTAVYVELTAEYSDEQSLTELLSQLDHKKSAEKQLNVVLTWLKLSHYNQGTFNPVPKKQLVDEGASASSIETLCKQGILRQERVIISRLSAKDSGENQFKPLSPAQQTALTQVEAHFKQHTTTLLFGVTGSGKTEIYVQLIQEQLDLGKQVLFLLPEIALTTQLIQRLSSYFGEQVGVYHSKFNQNERVEIWNTVLYNHPNRFRIILGARSAVFLPFQDLGLIIVDEEHESSFKQYDPSPRYNARDAAIVLAHLHKAKVLLGSATPSIETFYNAKQGKYGFVELTDRYGNIQLPEINCANLQKERKQKSMQSHFSSLLIDEMRSALNNKEQIILFQNRRGYTPLWSCEVCNWTPKCKNCDVSLTYHKQSNVLKCHYCSYVVPPIGTCSACGSNRLKMIGFGTEKIEDDLALIFPDIRIQRLDLDTTRSKNAYEELLTAFDQRKIDVLIGTQMVSKGLDFDNVSLVGVMDADMMLNRPDFRAFERSYQLMSQVAGRAGRKSKRGKVIIQTGDPDHWVIQHVMYHDYFGFYSNEIKERERFFYPPFFKLIEFTLKHKDEHLVDQAAFQFSQQLREVFKERVIGPEFPLIRKIQNNYLKSIKLKIEKDAPDKKVKERLNQLIDSFYSVPSHKSIRLVIDVDPS
jgi:primosomal protein N' (replication factor Y)